MGIAALHPSYALRREGRIASAEPVCSRAFFCACLHTRPRVQRAPGFPCALFLSWRVAIDAKLGRLVPRGRKLVSGVNMSQSVIASEAIAVGTPIAERPPHRTVRAAFPHTAPTSSE